MKELTGNLWDFHAQGHYICITTNGTVRRDGACVMGRGIAKQAAQKFPELPAMLGRMIESGRYDLPLEGNVPYVLPHLHLISFPVKWHWADTADLELIQESAKRLVEGVNLARIESVYLPRPGCGNGGLTWDVVRPVIAPILDDRFTVVEINP